MLLKRIVSSQIQLREARKTLHTTLREMVGDETGSVSTIAGIAALTIGVLAAAAIVVGVMTDHANAIPGPTE